MASNSSIFRLGGSAAALMVGLFGSAHAYQPTSATVAGSFQEELGCPADWQPWCNITDLMVDGSLWSGTFRIPAGDWEFKVALNGTWDVSYGDGSGNNAKISLAEATDVTFFYDEVSNAVSTDAPIPEPSNVTIAGSFQEELGCPGDWQAECLVTGLTFDSEDGVWQGTFNIPAGDWEYKAPINLSWSENYGTPTGGNIGLSVPSAQDVKFYFSNATKWVTDNVNSVIVTAAGNFQAQLGCPGDWQPWCLQSWMQDPDGDGIYTFATTDLAPGSYETKAALNEGWDESYGTPSGGNLPFTVVSQGDLIVFSFDSSTRELSIGGELPAGDLSTAKAYWLSSDVIAWDVPEGSVVTLHHAEEGGISLSSNGV
ncbi:MAG: hypothetical protein AAF317_21605, partial [Pseudomonadota bacterium]